MLDYFQTGAFLATSTETTLRGVLQDNFVRDIRINDFTLRGSDTVQSLLTFCAASILSRGVLVDLQVGIGLTNVRPTASAVHLPVGHSVLRLSSATHPPEQRCHPRR